MRPYTHVTEFAVGAACPYAAASARPLRGRVDGDIDPYKFPPHP